MASRTVTGFLLAALVAGSLLRLNGIDWGADPDTGEFHAFHPDESTIVRNSRWVGTDLRQIRMPYGFFPAYLLWGVSSLSGVSLSPDSNSGLREAHVLARSITAAMSVASIWVVFLIARTLGGGLTAALSAVLLAFCYGHVQQAHYYTVDPLLTTMVVLCLYLILRMPRAGAATYVAAGALVGAAVGTRLVGVLLLVPFILQHLPSAWYRSPARVLRALASVRTGVFLAALVVVAIACEPFSVLEPGRFFGDDELLTWRRSLDVSLGEVVFAWSLYDIGTKPFLFHLTDLLPYSLGLPLFAPAVAGCLLAVVLRNRAALVLLSWVIVYFAAVGGHHLKPVRYVLPLLPPLVVLAAWACALCVRRVPFRPVAYGVPALVICTSVAIGLTTWNIYDRTDARIEAAKWIEAHVPGGERVLTEVGGFPTNWMVSPPRRKRTVKASYFIHTKNCGTELAQIQHVRRLLDDVGWIALVEENRERQFLAAAGSYPVGYGLYARLKSGSLGFSPAARFKTNPGAGPVEFSRPYDEPTMTAFDHPTVMIYRRDDKAAVKAALAQWEGRRHSGDERLLVEGAEAIRSGSTEEAKEHLRLFTQRHPDVLVGQFLLGEVYGSGGSLKMKGVPYPSCMEAVLNQLLGLRMPELALETAELFIRHAASRMRTAPRVDLYHSAGLLARDLGEPARAADHFEKAFSLDGRHWQSRLEYARLCVGLGRRGAAEAAFEEVLRVDPGNAMAIKELARLRTGDVEPP